MSLNSPTSVLSRVSKVGQRLRGVSRNSKSSIIRSLGQALLFVIVIASLCAVSGRVNGAVESKKVLMLFSDEAHAPNQIILDQTMRSVLRQNSSVPVEIYCEYLDGVRIDPSAFESDLVNLLRRKYEGKKLDLVFTFSVASLKVLLKNRPTLFSDVPLIFLVLDQRNIAGLNLFATRPGFASRNAKGGSGERFQ
jgi:hypothetical protein